MKKLLGSIISGVGILIAGTSGLCSLAFLGFGFSAEGLWGIGKMIGPVLAFGCIPFGFGLGIVHAGRELVRHANSVAEEETTRKDQEPRKQEPTTPSSQENQ